MTAYVPSADATEPGAMARGVVAGAGLDGSGGGPGVATECPYDLPMGQGIRGGRPPRRWFLNRVVVPPPARTALVMPGRQRR